jgi:hypothetical protein
MSEKDNLEVLYHKLLVTVDDLLEHYDPLMIAGCMIAQSLAIYRTALSEEDYSKIVEGILEKKDYVNTFSGRNLH